jgi:hypothetical protein
VLPICWAVSAGRVVVFLVNLRRQIAGGVIVLFWLVSSRSAAIGEVEL